ncbi:hypothetical protein AAA605_16100 [Pseudomonas aeruginosa]|nr:hypothetical protein [Pseudomonas aeruginosa]
MPSAYSPNSRSSTISCAPWPGKRPWRCPRRDAQIRQQDRLVARFEGIARDSADPDLRRFADEWLARFYHHRELADQLRSGRAD